jgi:hypothetical protein
VSRPAVFLLLLTSGVASARGNVVAPRPVAPLDGATSITRRPELRWQLAAGTVGAEVAICWDAACADVIDTFVVDGNTVQPADDLPTGVLYWRLQSRVDGAAAGPATRPRALVVMASAEADLDGDGRKDTIVGIPAEELVLVTLQGRSVTLRAPVAGAGFGESVATGDLDGDGVPEILVGAPGAYHAAGAVFLYRNLGTEPTRTLRGPDGAGARFGTSLAVVGQLVAVGAPGHDGGWVHLYRPEENLPAAQLTGRGGRCGRSLSATDIDWDGTTDLVADGEIWTGPLLK